MENHLVFIHFLVIFILSGSVIIAGFYDLKYKIIPNELSYLLILIGIISNFIISFLIIEIYPILFSIILSIIIFSLSYILWKLRLWGGGDVKLITGITVAMPIHPAVLSEIFRFNINNINLPILAIYPFPFTVIFNSILVSFPFLLICVILNYLNNIKYEEIANNKNFKRNKSEKNLILILFNKFINIIINNININNSNNNHLFDLFKYIKIGIYKKLIFNKLIKSLLTSLILLIVILFFKRYDIDSINSIFYILIVGMFINLTFSIFLDFFILNFKIFVKKGSYKLVDINNLKENMILSDILINISDLNRLIKENKVNLNIINKIGLYKKNYSDCTDYINYIGTNDSTDYMEYSDYIDYTNYTNNDDINIDIYKNKDNHILKSKTAGGLSKNDLKLLKELAKIEIIPEKIPIKLGIPFAPSIAIGFFITLFIGDLSLFIYNGVNLLI